MFKSKRKWMVTTFLLTTLQPARLQYPMMGFGVGYPPPMFLPRPPLPIQMAVMPAIVIQETTTTTTTTTTPKSQASEDGNGTRIAIAIPVPVPMPVQMAFPAYPPPPFCQSQNKERPKNCPPCPPCVCTPSCTPSFFSYCSPCHQKCRCKSSNDAPIPQRPQVPVPVPGPAYPVPVPLPAPIIVVPYPPARIEISRSDHSRSTRCESSSASESSESSSSGSCTDRESMDSSYLRKGKETIKKKEKTKKTQKTKERQKTKKRRKKERKNKRSHKKKKRPKYPFWSGRRHSKTEVKLSEENNKLVEPVLSYLSHKGDVVFNTKLSVQEAKELLKDNKDKVKQGQTVHVLTGEEGGKQRILVMSEDGDNDQHDVRNKKVVLRNGMAHHVLGEGRKQLFFRAPETQKINNISVSFHISPS